MMGRDGDISAMMLWMSLCGFFSLVVVVLAVIVVVVIVRARRGRRALTGGSTHVDPSNADPAVQELRRRLAVGEIDEDEYLQRRATLQ